MNPVPRSHTHTPVGAATYADRCDHYIHLSQPASIHPGRPASVIQRLRPSVCVSRRYYTALRRVSHQFFTNQH